MVNLNHVALLVNNIEFFVEKNSIPCDLLGKIEEFPGEGTRELYVGKASQIGRLLLVEPIADGPYKQALEKRGAGLHHIAIDVAKVDDFVGELSGSGWFLHPRSLWFYDDDRFVFLARPGAPLIEVKEQDVPADGSLIESVECQFPNTRLIESLCCSKIKMGESLRVAFGNGEIMTPDFS